MIRFFLDLWKSTRNLRLTQTAGSLAFLTVLAMVPILSFAMSALSVLPQFEPLRENLFSFLKKALLLPGSAEVVLNYLNRFALQANSLSLVSALLFFASALIALITIDGTLNRIWGVTKPRALLRRIVLYCGVLALAPFVIGTSLAVNGLVFGDWLDSRPSTALRRFSLTVFPWISTGLALLLVYRFVPNTKVRWRHAFFGTLLTLCFMEIFRRGFAFYITQVPTFKVIYGAFAAIPLFLVWVYLAWLAILFGALFTSRLK
jgi:membrane protein